MKRLDPLNQSDKQAKYQLKSVLSAGIQNMVKQANQGPTRNSMFAEMNASTADKHKMGEKSAYIHSDTVDTSWMQCEFDFRKKGTNSRIINGGKTLEQVKDGWSCSQAKEPMTVDQDYKFFKIKIEAGNLRIVIGLAPKLNHYDRNHFYDEHKCYGLCLSTGRIWQNGVSMQYIEKNSFELGDTIGCHYQSSTNEIWFTKNKENLGLAFQESSFEKVTFYPTIMPTMGTICTFQKQLTGHDIIQAQESKIEVLKSENKNLKSLVDQYLDQLETSKNKINQLEQSQKGAEKFQQESKMINKSSKHIELAFDKSQKPDKINHIINLQEHKIQKIQDELNLANIQLQNHNDILSIPNIDNFTKGPFQEITSFLGANSNTFSKIIKIVDNYIEILSKDKNRQNQIQLTILQNIISNKPKLEQIQNQIKDEPDQFNKDNLFKYLSQEDIDNSDLFWQTFKMFDKIQNHQNQLESEVSQLKQLISQSKFKERQQYLKNMDQGTFKLIFKGYKQKQKYYVKIEEKIEKIIHH